MIDQVVDLAWIYDMKDYIQMFDLASADLEKKIFDFPAGISSFNAEMNARHKEVVSVDRSYDMSLNDMQHYANAVLEKNIKMLTMQSDRLNTDSNESLEDIFNLWAQRKNNFINDYSQGVADGRYLTPELPRFPYHNDEFRLALCSDLLFNSKLELQTASLITAEDMILEICRIAEEVRIFPLMTETGQLSEDLGPIMLLLQEHDYGLEVKEVPYHQQQGGNAMLRIWSQSCDVYN